MKEIFKIILFILLAPFFMTMALILTLWYEWWLDLGNFS
jgi:hypothetical protein